MTTAERIHLLRRHGLENAVVAAVLGVDVTEIVAHVQDPSHEVTVGGGGSVDVTGLLPLDGSRAMTGPLILGDASGAYLGLYGVPYTEGYAAAADNWIHTVQIVGEDGTRGAWRADGQLQWGDGTDAPDTALYRSGGFGPGYGVLAADAGGGFQVLSSAAGNEASFIQLSPDTGYGGYVWVHDLVGRTDQDALYFDVEGEANARFRIGIDGSMHWSDGTLAPDLSLERTNAGVLGIRGGGDDNAEFSVAVGDVTVGAHAAGGEDAYLEAYTGGTSLVLSGGHTGDADEIYFGQSSWQATMYRHAAGLIGIREHAGGYVAYSPDGTAYKLTPPNGGGAATWVAA